MMTKDEALRWLALYVPSGNLRAACAFSEIANMLASAIIPTPELREAVKFVCKAADAYYGVGVTFRSQPIAIAAVRAAFKEKDNA